jgi:tetratricopeptide (TPR) repeat protein
MTKNRIKLIVTLSILNIIFGLKNLSGQIPDIQNIFEQGNKFYEQGNFNEAIVNYELLISKGVNDKIVYYNLGNAYYRIKSLGKSILNYERAHKLSPRDEDINYNLNFVRTFVKEQEDNILYKIIDSFTMNELTLFVSITYFIFVACLIIYMFYKNIILKWIMFSFGYLLIISLILFYSKYTIQEKTIKGIVITTPAEARTGPGDDYSVGFTLPEGKKVIILTEKNGWYAIAVKQAEPQPVMLKGWIQKHLIEKI